jgi:hypothetical protein
VFALLVPFNFTNSSVRFVYFILLPLLYLYGGMGERENGKRREREREKIMRIMRIGTY